VHAAQGDQLTAAWDDIQRLDDLISLQNWWGLVLACLRCLCPFGWWNTAFQE
jgi:hypothetical protein